MDSVLFVFAAYNIHSVRILQDISINPQGLPLHRLQDMAKYEILWCCEAGHKVYPFVRAFAWLRIYDLLTRKRLQNLEARGLVKRRKAMPGSACHDQFVLTKLGNRFLRRRCHASFRNFQTNDTVATTHPPLMA